MVCSFIKNELETNCEKAETFNNLTKCIYDQKEKKCKEENKKCNEISSGATEEIYVNL